MSASPTISNGGIQSPSIFDAESMFDSHPIRYLLQCNRHGAATTANNNSTSTATPAADPASPTASPSSTTATNGSVASASPQSAAVTASATLTLKLRIPSTETRIEDGSTSGGATGGTGNGTGKTYTVFLIQLMSCCASFSVLRRYSDFCVLHRELSLEFPSASRLPALPTKKLIGSSMDADFVATRRAALEAYLVKLFNEPMYVNSKALCQFFVQTREVANVNIRIGSNPTSRTSSTSSNSTTDLEVATLTSRMSSITSQLQSLEQKLKWVESSSGAQQSQTLEHEIKMISNTIQGLQRKVGILELQQPYLQQMADATKQPGSATIPSAMPIGHPSLTTSMSSGSLGLRTSPPSSATIGSGTLLNGNARPFHVGGHSGNSKDAGSRSVSGPVANLRYDHDDFLDAAAAADEEDDDFNGVLPKRSISQRTASAIIHEKRYTGWPSGGSTVNEESPSLAPAHARVAALIMDAADDDHRPSASARSLSESHVHDRERPLSSTIGGYNVLSSNPLISSTTVTKADGGPSLLPQVVQAPTPILTAPASSTNSGNTTARTNTPSSGPNALPVRSVLDNSSRSLSSIDPWHSHKFQLRNRAESSAVAAVGQYPRLTTRQHSDPLAATSLTSVASAHWYKQWVEELGIEVAAGGSHEHRHNSNNTNSQYGGSQYGDADSRSSSLNNKLQASASSPSLSLMKLNQHNQQLAAQNNPLAGYGQGLMTNGSDSGNLLEKTSLFAGFGNAFPFISKKRSSAPTVGGATSTSASDGKSIFGAPSLTTERTTSDADQSTSSPSTLGLSIPPPVLSGSPAILLPKPTLALNSGTDSGGGSSKSSVLGDTDQLPHSPELGSSPALGSSPEIHALTSNAQNRSTLSPRAYGISPVNLSTIFPPPKLRSAPLRSSLDADDDDDETTTTTTTEKPRRDSFAFRFEKEKVHGEKVVTERNESSRSSSLTGVAVPQRAQTPSTPTTTQATLSLTTANGDEILLELDHTHVFYQSCIDAQLNTRMNEFLTFISPSAASEARYNSVLQFIDGMIKRVIGAEVFCHGSFALKTYLPDADLDVSAFFSKVLEDSWVQKLVGALCQEAAIPTAGPQFAVKSVSFINAVCQVVKCQIGSISVDISGNQTGALATLALFEEVDTLVGQNHLFKRTILLTKTWCENEMNIVESGSGMLSSYCIRALVLYIFNAYHMHIKTPLQGLYYLLSYFGQFNFMDHAVGVYGPILLTALPKFSVVTDGPCAWPQDTVPLVSRQLLSAYSLVATAPSIGSSHKHKTHTNETLVRTYFNVTDPCNPFNNLGRSVSQTHAPIIRQTFKTGSINMRRMMNDYTAYLNRRNVALQLANAAAASEDAVATITSTEDTDAQESYSLVSRMFPKTIAKYSSFGGRGRFLPPRRKRIGQTDSGSSAIASGSASPLLSNSPSLRPVSHTPTPDILQAPDRSSSPALLLNPATPTPLDANLPRILDNLNQARQFETPDVSENDLVVMIRKLLLQYGSVPVGKLGSLLHNVMNNHSLPSMLKERYGGLKKFLERHTDQFLIGTDHPFNPSTHLSPQAMVLAQKEAEDAAAEQLVAQAALQPQQQHNPHYGNNNHGGPNYHNDRSGGGRSHSGQYGGGGGGGGNRGGQHRGSMQQQQQQYGSHYQSINNNNNNMYNNQKQHGGGNNRYNNNQQGGSGNYSGYPMQSHHQHVNSPPHMQGGVGGNGMIPQQQGGASYARYQVEPDYDFPSVGIMPSVMKRVT